MKDEGTHDYERLFREASPVLWRTLYGFTGGRSDIAEERALRKLSPNQRAAMIPRFEVDLPTQEVASRTGVSQATVRVHIHRGRKRLRELLGSDEVDDA